MDYKALDEEEKREASDFVREALELLAKGRRLSPRMAAPELRLGPEESLAVWLPPFEVPPPNPGNNLENLVYFDRVIVPIRLCGDRQDFASCHGLPPEELAELIGLERFFPVLTTCPSHYEGIGFYEELFEACRRARGHYPPHVGHKLYTLQLYRVAFKRLTEAGVEPRPGLDPIEAFFRRFPEFNPFHVRDVELPGLGPGARAFGSDLARDIYELRAFGFSELVRVVLSLYKGSGELGALAALRLYRQYLVAPLADALGGFRYYTSGDFRTMVSASAIRIC